MELDQKPSIYFTRKASILSILMCVIKTNAEILKIDEWIRIFGNGRKYSFRISSLSRVCVCVCVCVWVCVCVCVFPLKYEQTPLVGITLIKHYLVPHQGQILGHLRKGERKEYPASIYQVGLSIITYLKLFNHLWVVINRHSN